MADAKSNLTILDLAKRLDPNGKVARIVEKLNLTNEIMQDLVTIQANDITGHRTTIRTGLPEAGWKILYEGTPSSKSITQQVTDTCGILEAFSEVDEDAITINGNMFDYRLSEATAFTETMNQGMAKALLYSNTAANPEQPHGLAVRYNTLSPDVPIHENVIDAGGTDADELSSIWLIVWGENTIHGIYPNGSELGLRHIDNGRQRRETVDPDGTRRTYYVYEDQYKWKLGFCVRDWRYGVRIANVPVNRLKDSLFDIVEKMIEAEELIPSLSMGRAAWYMNRRVRTALRQNIIKIPNVNLVFDNVSGKMITYMNEIPVRRVDALLNTEARVTAA